MLFESIPFLASSYLIFLILSGFFSGVEAAFIGLDRVNINRFEESKGFLSKNVNYFIKHFDYFITSILFFNLFNNTYATVTGTLLLKKIYQTHLSSLNLSALVLFLISIVPLTGSILIFGEIVPKRIAIRFPGRVALLGTLPMIPVYWAFYPFSRIFSNISQNFIKIFIKTNINRSSAFDKREFIKYLKLSSDTGVLKEIESTMLQNLVTYKSMPVKSILIPRQEVQGFDISKFPSNPQKAIREFSYNTIPVYDKIKDNIIGVLSKRKLAFKSNLEELNKKNIRKYLSIPIMVPESKNLLEVLSDMRQGGVETAIVTDEYGGIEGIVTYGWVVKKLLGKGEVIEPELKGIKKLTNGSYSAHPQTSLVEINNYFKTNIRSEHAETLGGYLVENLNDIPRSGTVYRDKYFEYHIKSSNQKKILKLAIRTLK